MPKNMIRKSLALGATSALVVTGFAALPANAAGLADKSFVSLAPTDGAEYDVLTGVSKTFSLTANEASSVAGTGRNLKFLVTDADSKIEPTVDTIGRTISIGADTGGVTGATDSDDVATIKVANDLTKGDYISFSGDLVKTGDTTIIVDASDGPFEVLSATSSQFTVAGDTTSTGETQFKSAVTIEVLREARASDGSYVVDSGIATDAKDEVLVLSTGSAEDSTRSVTVTAWVDNNGNDEIDATEYTSETRTVTFHKADAVAATATIQTLTVGDTSVVAHVATTPTLNGDQMSNDDVTAEFTVQGSPTKFTPGAGSSKWNTTKNVWVSTLERSHNVDSTTFATPTVTMKFSANHDLTTGETVVVSGMEDAGNNGTFVVTKKDADEITFSNTSGKADGTDAPGVAKVAVVAGSYSARAKAGSTFLGSATGSSVATVTSDDGATAVVETANINTTVDGSGDATAKVRSGTLAIEAVMSFVDSDDVAVTAGRPVVLTVNADSVEGLTVNGTSVDAADTVAATTDANGQVTVAITATDADDTEAIKITGVAEGISGTGTFVDIAFADATNTLYDLNGNDTASTVRYIPAGASYTFNFSVRDQWSQLLTGDYRLKVAASGNTVSETYPSISTGSASVTITDTQISTAGDIAVVVTPQKLQTDGTWKTTGAPTAITYTLKTGAAGNGAVTIGSVSAVDLSQTALAAGDTRTTQSDVTTSTSGAITLTGSVTDASTGEIRPGAEVSVSGGSNILFYDGVRASYGSLTTHATTAGAYTVYALSSTAQVDSVVTVSALGGSKTVKVTFNAAEDNTGAAITVDAPDAVLPGTTVTFTISVVDKFGNPVTTDSSLTAGSVFNDGTTSATTPGLTVTYTGPGLRIGDLPTKTDANGQAKVTVLLGSNDSGSASLTAQYDGDTNSTTNTNVYAVTKSVTIGSTYGSMTAWTKDMGDGTAKVYIKFPTIGEKVRIGHQTGGSGSYETIYVKTLDSESHPDLTVNANGSYIVRTIDLVDGTNRIRVTVGDTTEVQVRYNE